MEPELDSAFVSEVQGIPSVMPQIGCNFFARTALSNALKSSPFKVSLADRLRAETTHTLVWIAKRLQLGTRGYLAQVLLAHTTSAKPPTFNASERS